MTDTTAPLWFISLLDAVVQRQSCQLRFDDDNSDVGSVLAELQSRCRWNVDDYGEDAVLEFPGDRVRVNISRGAIDPSGRPCCHFHVQLLPHL
jgi:hypothetical protein